MSKIISPDAQLRFAAARHAAVKTHPYFAKMLWAITPIQKEHPMLTTAVDKSWRLYYSPTVVMDWTIEDFKTGLIHEIRHLLGMHFNRADSLWPQAQADGLSMEAFQRICNHVQDAEINDDLQAEGLKMLETDITPDKLNATYKTNEFQKHKLFEEYYRILLKHLKKQQQCQGQGNPTGNPNDNKDGKPSRNCGSGAHGQQAEWEEPASGTNPTTGERVAPGISEAEANIIRKHIAEEVKKVAAQKGQGTLPAGLLWWAENFLSPKIPWKQELRACIRNAVAKEAGQVDYTMSRRSRRHHSSEVWIAGLYAPIPEIAFLLDSSGSMSDAALQRGVSEVQGVLKALGMKKGITFISGDAQVQTQLHINNARQAKVGGRGGTNMALLLEHAARNLKPKPQIIILVTDLETNWPTEPLGIQTIVVGVEATNSHYKNQVPDWAKLIIIDD